MIFSVITASVDRPDLLVDAIRQVRSQSTPRFHIQHIVVTDREMVVPAMRPTDNYSLQIVLAARRGVYAAWNVGLAHAGGDVIGLVNDDDRLPPRALERVLEAFTPTTDIVTGAAEVIDATDQSVRNLDAEALLEGNYWAMLTYAPMINARWIRKEAIARTGPFDEGLSIAGDREFLLRLKRYHLHHRITRTVLYQYVSHPASLSFGSQAHPRAREEELTILRRERALLQSASDRRHLEQIIARVASQGQPLRARLQHPLLTIRAAQHRARELWTRSSGGHPLDHCRALGDASHVAAWTTEWLQ